MTSFPSAYWRGRVPLAASFWLVGIALATLLVISDQWLVDAARSELFSSRARWLPWAAIAMLSLILIPVWQIAGLWRAADFHMQQVGTILAGRCVQVAATLLTVLLTVRVLDFSVEASHFTQLAFSRGVYSATLAEGMNGRELRLKGGIGYGLAARVEEFLRGNERIRRLRLASPGGSFAEARRLRRVVEKYALNTYVDGYCSGVCVSVVVGGRHRYLGSGGRIAMRMPAARWARTELREFRARGVTAGFLARWRANSRQLWVPGHRELRAGGLIHTILGNFRLGPQSIARTALSGAAHDGLPSIARLYSALAPASDTLPHTANQRSNHRDRQTDTHERGPCRNSRPRSRSGSS